MPKVMEKDFLKITIVILVIMVIIIVVTYSISNIIAEGETKNIIQTRTIRINLISEWFSDKINNSLRNLEITSQLEQVRSSNFAKYIDSTTHGIPENMDIEKRQIAQQILANDPQLAVVRFFMPNGDIYMQEPYSAQLKLKQLNYAYRDYFNGTISTGRPYVSEVFKAQSLDFQQTVGLGVPIYSNSGTLLGVWSGLFNPLYVNKFLDNLSMEPGTMVMIFDHKGQPFINTNNQMMKNNYTNYANFINEAIHGKNGVDITFENGIKTFVLYHYIVIGNHKWTILLTQPYDETFFVANHTHQLSYTIIVASVLISILSILVTYMILYSRKKLKTSMENKNLDLVKIKKQFKTLYDEDPDMLCTVDSKGIIIECNRTFALTLDYSKNTLIGRSIFDHVADKSIESTIASFSTFISNGRIRDNEVWLKKRNSNEFPCLVSINGNYDESGGLTGVVIIRNMTLIYEAKERIISEKLIRSQFEEVSKIRSALDEASLFSTTDKNGIITYANKKFCEISGYSNKELIGQNHRIIKSDYHPPEFYENIWKTISSGQIWRGDIKNINKQGKYYWVKTTIMPIFDKNGVIQEYLSVRTDITSQKNIEEDLEKAVLTLQKIQKQKETFFSMISHELKTPIVPILGYCEMFQKGMLGVLTHDQIEAISEIFDNSRRMQKLILDLLDSNKLDLGKMAVNKKIVKTGDFMKKLFAKYEPIMNQKNIKFLKFIDDSTVLADPDRMIQIFENLIQNAISFISKENGIIEIGVRNEEFCAVFYVKDNGIGIRKDKQLELFRPFYQADTSFKRKHGGVGLGLSICKGFVETMRGRMWVESDEGKGTTFFFDIPKTEIPEITTDSNKSKSEGDK